MSAATPRHPGFAPAVRASFARQGVPAAWGATMDVVEPGRVERALPFGPTVTQQQGFFHGGVVATLGDSAGGYAAMTLLDAGREIVSVEDEVTFVAPAVGERLEAVGTRLEAGRPLPVAEARVDVVRGSDRRLCAVLFPTLAPVDARR